MIFEPIFKVRPINNLKDMINQSVELYSENNAFMLKNADGSYKGVKYSDFKSDIDGFGTALINLGLKDKFIAVISENRYEWCVTYLSTVNGAGVIVPLDKELPLSEIENLLIRSDASAVVFSKKYEKEMRMLAATLPSIKYFIRMDREERTSDIGIQEGSDSKFLSFKSLIDKGRNLIASGNRTFIDADIDCEKMCSLIFTSGTTDLAKAVMLSHKNICADVMGVCQSLYIDSSDSSLSILPIHHTYECTAGFLVIIYNGCTMYFNEGLKHISKNLKEYQPTLLFLVPLILENMYKKIWDQVNKKMSTKVKMKVALLVSNVLLKAFKIDIRRKLFRQIHENIGGKVRLIISGAAGIDPKVLAGFHALGINVLQGYGLTECSPIVTVNREGIFKHSSIGQPLPGIEVKLVDVNSEGVGELVVKGNNVMLGYHENKLATEKVLKDGWFYTGDLGYMDKKGYFYITGRKKNVIVTKNGKNIFPEEVETYLNKCQCILECLVWGKYDEESNETYVNAQIVPDLEAIKEKLKIDNPSSDDIHKAISLEVKSVNKIMPLYKRVREFTIRDTEFEKTTTKKIKRYAEKIS